MHLGGGYKAFSEQAPTVERNSDNISEQNRLQATSTTNIRAQDSSNIDKVTKPLQWPEARASERSCPFNLKPSSSLSAASSSSR